MKNGQMYAPTSAVAFGFCILLEKAGDIPIGIIHALWEVLPLEAWMPRDIG